MAAQLSIRHVGGDPLLIENAGIEAIANLKLATFSARDTRQTQSINQRASLIIGYRFSVSDAPVKIEQVCNLDFTMQHSLPDKEQIVVTFTTAGRDKESLAQSINIIGVCDANIFGYRLTQSLCEIWMTTCPMKYALEQRST